MMNSLDSLRGLPLIEAFFEGNPFKTRIRDKSTYVRYFKNFSSDEGVT